MEYVTRPGANFARAATIWLLRRLIDPNAKITMLPAGDVIAYAAEHDALPIPRHEIGADEVWRCPSTIPRRSCAIGVRPPALMPSGFTSP